MRGQELVKLSCLLSALTFCYEQVAVAIHNVFWQFHLKLMLRAILMSVFVSVLVGYIQRVSTV
ncbi:hypothetical protein HMPREF2845_01970 [Rothia sp. HMSC065B04]|nr:hypothetical protein HMPREF2845_01970 [Rothia sp. HMSC065B04]